MLYNLLYNVLYNKGRIKLKIAIMLYNKIKKRSKMLDLFKSKEVKKLEKIKEKEIERQKKYKRVNVVFKEDEFLLVDEFLKKQDLSLTQYVKTKLEEDMKKG